MEVIYGKNQQIEFSESTGIGLGNFDGLHIAHMALVNTLISETKQRRLKSLLYTFTKHPENIMRKRLFTPMITSVNKKLSLLDKTELNYTYLEKFDENFSRMSPEAFVQDILINKLKMKLAVTGFDYRFGYRGQGDVEYLKELGRKYDFDVVTIPPVTIDSEVVSSTLIRKYVKKGDMDSAYKLLGRHYSITGIVESGKKLGNKLGFPTANIYPEDYLLIPVYGVYVTRTLLNGRLYNSITNIGNNPTFNDQKVSIETYIMDYNQDIYGEGIEVFFLKKIRGERKFNAVEDLVEQIRRDMESARKYFDDFGNGTI